MVSNEIDSLDMGLYDALLNCDDLGQFKMGMRTSTLLFTQLTRTQCINLSIHKWELVVATMTKRELEGDYRIPIDGAVDTCALCRKYMNHWVLHMKDPIFPCDGCPVAAHTGMPYCSESPYEGFTDMRTLADSEYTDGRTSAGEYKEALAFAEQEVDFLRSLLNEDDDDV